jgi:hypothetical protein
MSVNTESGGSFRTRARDKQSDFLLIEYSHVSESLLRNEESGEKRAAFFVTAVGAAAGVLGFVFGGDQAIVPREHLAAAGTVSAAVLLCLGIFTVRRLIERHIVTDQYIFALRALRRLFLSKVDAAAVSNAFFAPYAPAQARSLKVLSIGKGGWLETVAMVNALLAGTVAACAMVALDTPASWNAILMVAVTLAAWIGQIRYARQVIARKHAKLACADAADLRNTE